jgi:spore germination protein YaaH
VQVNIEPMPNGDEAFPVLLAELKAALPDGKILSVAAYPPPTRWHPFVEVHWDEEYSREIARHADLLVPMMYDTSIRLGKPYQRLMARWTQQILDWAGNTEVLLGVPAYGDAGVGYHHPEVENLRNALRGIHAGLRLMPSLPDGYLGVSIYCEWEMDDQKWDDFRKEFERSP